MIHYTDIVFIIILLLLSVLVASNFASFKSGGSYGGGKRRWDLDIVGLIYLIFFIVFGLLWVIKLLL